MGNLRTWNLTIIIFTFLFISGCATSFQADPDFEVDASTNIGDLQIIHNDSGVLYDWFVMNNAFNENEARVVKGHYDEMVRVLSKLREKAVAGLVDYHRLKYAVEDLTDAWQKLRPELQIMIDIVDKDNPGIRLEDRLAIAMWNRLKADMDQILTNTNVTLKKAEDEMDAATYAQFRRDAKGIVQTLSPLMKMIPLPGLSF